MISVHNPGGPLSCPIGQVHLKYGDGSYHCIIYTDVFDEDTVRLIEEYIEKNKIEDVQEAIFVNPLEDIYWVVYPVFSPYRLDYSYIEKDVRRQQKKGGE